MIIQADEHLDASQVQNALNNANITEVANVEVNVFLVSVSVRAVFRCLTTFYLPLITARVRSTRDDNVFTLSVH